MFLYKLNRQEEQPNIDSSCSVYTIGVKLIYSVTFLFYFKLFAPISLGNNS